MRPVNDAVKQPATVADIAERLGAILDGDGHRAVLGVSGVREARPDEISFVSSSRYAADAAVTRAAALIVPFDWDRACPAALLRVSDPDAAVAQVAGWFAPETPAPALGVHATAVVGDGVRMGEGVSVGPLAVIEPGVVLGDRVVVGAQCYVGYGCRLGDDTRLYPQVSLREHVRIGQRVIVHNGTVIGSDGFGYQADAEGGRAKVPQIGTVDIGDDVEIGANVAVDRARFGRTVIGRGVKIDNLVQIAHNVFLGDHAVIVAQVGISGSTRIGARAVLAGQAGVVGHVVVGEGAIVGAQAGVTKDVPAGAFVSGYPAAPHQRAMRAQAYLAKLPEMREQLRTLERRLARLERTAKA